MTETAATFQESDFALFWAIEPDAQDWTNLELSRVKRVMLTYTLAKTQPLLLQELNRRGISVIIRVEDDQTDTPDVIAFVCHSAGTMCNLVCVIAGCEPDAGTDFKFGAPNWSEAKARASAARTDAIRLALGSTPCIAPALSCPPDLISEDGILHPGYRTFADNMRVSSQACAGAGGHIYALGWGSINDVNEIRFKFLLKALCENWHVPIWLDELGVTLGGNNVAQMNAYIRMADIILRHPARDRVRLFCPFISAGIPGAWPSQFLLKDPAAYAALGNWMAS